MREERPGAATAIGSPHSPLAAQAGPLAVSPLAAAAAAAAAASSSSPPPLIPSSLVRNNNLVSPRARKRPSFRGTAAVPGERSISQREEGGGKAWETTPRRGESGNSRDEARGLVRTLARRSPRAHAHQLATDFGNSRNVLLSPRGWRGGGIGEEGGDGGHGYSWSMRVPASVHASSSAPSPAFLRNVAGREEVSSVRHGGSATRLHAQAALPGGTGGRAKLGTCCSESPCCVL